MASCAFLTVAELIATLMAMTGIAVHIRLIDHDQPGPGEVTIAEWDEQSWDPASGPQSSYQIDGVRWDTKAHYIETGSTNVVVTARRS